MLKAAIRGVFNPMLTKLLFVVCIGQTVYGQISDPNNPIDGIISGNVLSYESIKYDAISKFGNFIKKDNKLNKSICYFNEKNKIDSVLGVKTNNDSIKQGYTKILYDSMNRVINIFQYRDRYGIKTTKNSFYKYDLMGNIVELNVIKNDTLAEREVARYNLKNKLLNYVVYGEDGNVERERECKYDKEGNVTEEIYYNKNYFSREKNAYNKQNNITLKIVYDKNDQPDKKTSYFYNSNNQLIKTINSYSNSSEFNSSTTIYYDLQGRIIKELVVYPNYSAWNKTITYKYTDMKGSYEKEEHSTDGTHKLIEAVSYDERGRIIEKENAYLKETYKYDNNNITEKLVSHYDYNKEENTNQKVLNSVSKTVYIYDKKGNWIKKIESYNSNEDSRNLMLPTNYTVTERNFTYR